MLIIAYKKRIQNNPFTLSGVLYPLVDNGYGEMIEDKQGISVNKSYTNHVRISTKKRWTLDQKDNKTPVTTDITVWYMISDNETAVDIRLYFTYANFNFKITQRKKIIKHGVLIGYEYELKDVTEDNYNG